MLKPGDILAIEAGSCELPLLGMRLPEGVRSQAQVLWSSIGWAGPAAMGIAIAEPSRRVVLVSGDGAAYIEVMIPAAENVPLPEEALDAYFKLRTPTDV